MKVGISLLTLLATSINWCIQAIQPGDVAVRDAVREHRHQWIAGNLKKLALHSAPKQSTSSDKGSSVGDAGSKGKTTVRTKRELSQFTRQQWGDIGKVLACASQLDITSASCSGLIAINKDETVLALKDDKKETIYIGYSFFINHPFLKTDYYDRQLFERAQAIWTDVHAFIEANPGYEYVNVGYGPGGSLAYLMAQRILYASDYLSRPGVELNQFRQVKVITFGEYPTFPENYAEVDVVGDKNHATFLFSKDGKAPEDAAAIALAGIKIFIKESESASIQELQMAETKIAKFLSRERELKVIKRNAEHYKEFKAKIARHLHVIREIAKTTATLMQSPELDFVSQAQRVCSAQLQQQLEQQIPRDADWNIVCEVVHRKTAGFPSKRDKFTIECMIELEPSKRYNLASYSALLSQLSTHADTCTKLSPAPFHKDEWSTCIKDIFEQGDLYSLISPHSSQFHKGQKGPIYRFYGNVNSKAWAFQPQGCTVVPEHNEAALEAIYKANRKLFYSLLSTRYAFSNSCANLFDTIVLEGSALKQAETLNDDSVALINAIGTSENKGRYRKPSKLPGLFTKQGEVGPFEITNNHTSLMFIADDPLVEKIRTCLINQKTTMIDCTNPHNQWMKKCPQFCTTKSKSKDKVALCANMLYCEEIDAYVGMTFNPKIDEIFDKLKHRPVNQYSIITYTKAISGVIPKWLNKATNLLTSKLWMHHLGIFFITAPKIETLACANKKAKKKVFGLKSRYESDDSDEQDKDGTETSPEDKQKDASSSSNSNETKAKGLNSSDDED